MNKNKTQFREITESVLKTMQELREGKIDTNTARTANQIYGNVIRATELELKYEALQRRHKGVYNDFLEPQKNV